MIWKTLAVDKMDIEKTADLKCISRLLVEKWHVDQIKMKITVSPEVKARATHAANHLSGTFEPRTEGGWRVEMWFQAGVRRRRRGDVGAESELANRPLGR